MVQPTDPKVFKNLDELFEMVKSLDPNEPLVVRHQDGDRQNTAEAVFQDLDADLKVDARFKLFKWSNAAYKSSSSPDNYPYVFTIWKKPPPLN